MLWHRLLPCLPIAPSRRMKRRCLYPPPQLELPSVVVLNDSKFLEGGEGCQSLVR